MFSFMWQVLVITTWTTTLVNDPVRYSWFAFHPPLQTLALCFFTYGLCSLSLCHCLYLSLTYPTWNWSGIMTLQPTHQAKTKVTGFIRHQRAIFFFGTPILFLGILASVPYKIEKGYPHFLTWHAVIFFTFVKWIWLRESGWAEIRSNLLDLDDHSDIPRCRKRLEWRVTFRRRHEGEGCLEVSQVGAVLSSHPTEVPFFALKIGCLVIFSLYSGCLPFTWVVASLHGEERI